MIGGNGPKTREEAVDLLRAWLARNGTRKAEMDPEQPVARIEAEDRLSRLCWEFLNVPRRTRFGIGARYELRRFDLETRPTTRHKYRPVRGDIPLWAWCWSYRYQVSLLTREDVPVPQSVAECLEAALLRWVDSSFELV